MVKLYEGLVYNKRCVQIKERSHLDMFCAIALSLINKIDVIFLENT